MFWFFCINILDLPRKGTLCHFTDDAVMICIMNKYDVYEILNTFLFRIYDFLFFFWCNDLLQKNLNLKKLDYFVFFLEYYKTKRKEKKW